MGLLSNILGGAPSAPEEVQTLALGPSGDVQQAIAIARQDPPPELANVTNSLGAKPHSLRHADLSGFHATASELEECCVEGANFSAAKIDINTAGNEIRLRGTRLNGAIVTSHQGSFFMDDCTAQGMECRGEFAQFHMANVDASTMTASGVRVAEFEASHTKMCGANLKGMTIALGSNVRYCDLAQADMQQLNACGVNFTGTSFVGANLQDIVCDGTTSFKGCDMRGVKGITPKQLRDMGCDIDFVAPGSIVIGDGGVEKFADAPLQHAIEMSRAIEEIYANVVQVQAQHAYSVAAAPEKTPAPSAAPGICADMVAGLTGGGFAQAAIMSYAEVDQTRHGAQSMDPSILKDCGTHIHQQVAQVPTQSAGDMVADAGRGLANNICAVTGEVLNEEVAMQPQARDPEYQRPVQPDVVMRSLT